VRLLGETGQLYSYFAILHNQQQFAADAAATIACRDGDQLEIMTLASGG
jgi:sulfur carrier protein ThiS